ncbi:hypothetical protein QQX98_002759 [Neonectria punicea]|uniref:Uncharacterized protein n=1 Tax=Neonectria punicea TaxID=979145 RepID=A0ABR1HGN6_9HYPO
MAAEGGPLFLGAIFRNLEFRRPALNRLHRGEVREELKYPPVTQTGFRETRSTIREGTFETWVKALSDHVGGSATVSGSSDKENMVACEQILTTYFDPDDQHLSESFAVEPIQNYLEGLLGWTAELYMITGLNVANKLEYNNANTSQGQVGGQLGIQDHHTSTGGGFNARVGGGNKHDLEFVVADIVVGYRVNKYRCVRRINPFSKDRKVKDDGVLEGEMLDDEEAKADQPQIHFEAVPILEEAIGPDEVIDGDTQERWVVLKA